MFSKHLVVDLGVRQPSSVANPASASDVTDPPDLYRTVVVFHRRLHVHRVTDNRGSMRAVRNPSLGNRLIYDLHQLARHPIRHRHPDIAHPGKPRPRWEPAGKVIACPIFLRVDGFAETPSGTAPHEMLLERGAREFPEELLSPRVPKLGENSMNGVEVVSVVGEIAASILGIRR